MTAPNRLSDAGPLAAAAAGPRRGVPGDVLLVSCYEPGYQPLALASPAAFLRQEGYQPVCLDLAVEDLEAVGLAPLRAARMIAISIPMHTATVLGLRVAERARRLNPGAHICFYGLYAQLNAQLLRRPGADGRPIADTVFGPECEELLVTLANSLGDAAAAPPPVGEPRRLHRLPFLAPDRQGLPPLDRYARLLIGDERRVTGYVETTRGCLFLCRHCPIPPIYEGRFFAVPADLVCDDIATQVAAGARHIVFGDPDFLNSAKHALAIVRRMHANHPQLTFSFTAKVEHIIAHRDIFPELAALGCLFMVSAVESLSDQVLTILDKRHTRADVFASLKIVRAAGISLRPTFVAFTPWTTLSDYLDLCALIATEQLQDEVDPVQLAIRLLIPPGSLLLDRPELAPFLAPGPFDERSLTYAWNHPDPRMDALFETVSALAEEAARVDEPPAVTFSRIHAAAQIQAGGAPEQLRDDSGRGPATVVRTRPPRLSEPWFCCAQPTRTQLGSSSCATTCSGDVEQRSDVEAQSPVRLS